MSKATVRTPGMLVLGNRVWLEELTLELTRLGHPQAEAERAAKSALIHIVSRAQWPRAAYLAPDDPLEELTP